MATNPFFSNKTSPNGATAPNDSLNESSKRYFRGYNKFNLTRTFFNTERYADINLVDVIEGVEGDKLSIANKHLIRSHTFKSPKMFDIYKKKTYFAVNNKAILPINWEKVYKQHNKGDDVDDSVNCVSLFLYDIFYSLSNAGWVKSAQLPFNTDNANFIFRYLFLLESIFSSGSLLASMNCHLRNSVTVFDDADEKYYDFDFWLERVFTMLSSQSLVFQFPSLGDKYFSNRSIAGLNTIVVDSRILFDMLRTFSDWKFSSEDTSSFNLLKGRFRQLSINVSDDPSDTSTINLSRLIAYQLCCCQFYTRDSVDNIYTSEMFIDNAKATVMPFVSCIANRDNQLINRWRTFTYNGTRYDYDVFSGHVIDTISLGFFNWPDNTAFMTADNMLNCYNYLHMIFFYRKSLRYGDYFVGAKTLPYSPMDVTADVVGQGVSALDITRSIIAQRFANAVERVSNTWKDYLKGVTGGVASPNVYEPRFLASSTSTVDGFEVENTSSDQRTNNNITTVLKSGNSNYVYEIEVGEPCIIIGLSTYEVPRVYSATVDRFFKHTNRFNMFNKFFQNIGDQEISQQERNSAFSPLRTFGYTPRHMEYKQRYPIAAGGFVDNLPGYAFITDNQASNQNDVDLGDSDVISSYYLRNRNSEFDRFYASLTGYSLSHYFHFQVKYTNICHATRQMEYSPSIL